MARATNLLSLALLGTFADESASLLFGSHLMDPSGQTISWIYLQQRILYIVASVPSLMQLPYGSGYNVVVQHLEGSYGIIAAFIEYLGKRRAGNDLDYASQILPYTPDLILMLVQGVSKACLLTVDYLCARYAAALANETRREISILHGQDQPQGTGESSPSQMQSDPLTTLQLRLLTMWLQEENDPKVREGAIKLMDILFGLYTQDDEILEPILMVIEQITSHANGVDQFHVTEGWTTLFDDLQSIVGIPSLTNEAHDSGMRIIKILNQVATDDIKRGNSHEDWIEFVRLACGLDAEGSVEALELRFTIAALATNLYRSHLQKESEKSPETFKGLVEASKKLLAVRDRLSEQFVEILVEAMKDLRLLKRNSARNMAMRVADAYRRDVGY